MYPRNQIKMLLIRKVAVSAHRKGTGMWLQQVSSSYWRHRRYLWLFVVFDTWWEITGSPEPITGVGYCKLFGYISQTHSVFGMKQPSMAKSRVDVTEMYIVCTILGKSVCDVWVWCMFLTCDFIESTRYIPNKNPHSLSQESNPVNSRCKSRSQRRDRRAWGPRCQCTNYA